MQRPEIENRRYKRAFFTLEEELLILFRVDEKTPTALAARVMNISRGGMGLIAKRGVERILEKGMRLSIVEFGIQGADTIRTDGALAADVRWILDNDFLDHVGFGCQYLDPDAAVVTQIEQFINDRLPGRLDWCRE